jgi:hypothetical protein
MAVRVEVASEEKAVEETSDNAKVSLDFSLPLSGSASTVSSDSDLDRMESVLNPWEAQQQRGRQGPTQHQLTRGLNGTLQQSTVSVQSSPPPGTVPKTTGTSLAPRVQPQQAVGGSVMMQQLPPVAARIVRPPGGMRLISGSA